MALSPSPDSYQEREHSRQAKKLIAIQPVGFRAESPLYTRISVFKLLVRHYVPWERACPTTGGAGGEVCFQNK